MKRILELVGMVLVLSLSTLIYSANWQGHPGWQKDCKKSELAWFDLELNQWSNQFCFKLGLRISFDTYPKTSIHMTVARDAGQVTSEQVACLEEMLSHIQWSASYLHDLPPPPIHMGISITDNRDSFEWYDCRLERLGSRPKSGMIKKAKVIFSAACAKTEDNQPAR